MDTAFASTPTVGSIKVIGNRVQYTATVTANILMENNIMDTIFKTSKKVLVFLLGLAERFMKGNGKMTNKMDQVK